MPPIDALQINLAVLLPAFAMVVFAMFVMLVDLLATDARPGLRNATPWVALAGVIASAFFCWWLWDQPVQTFQGMATSDHFALGVDLIVLTATALGILLS